MDSYSNRPRRSGRTSDERRWADDGSRSARSRYAHEDGASSEGYGRGRSSRANDYSGFNEGAYGESASSYSRRAQRAEQAYAKELKKRKRRKIIIIALAIVFALALAGAAFALVYYATISSNMHEGVDEQLENELVDVMEPGDPFYMLLMGADRSEDRVNSSEYSGDTFRSDSMILCRVDPENKQITMVSLHRDTMTDMGEYGWQKLNAAHAFGGPALAVKMVSEMAGVDIAHYAEIDFDGFKEAVDALGGVEVDVPMTINDSMAGGYVEKGLQTLNGDQALILCRARHAYDDYGDGDRYRAANQRLVLSAVAKKILSSDVPTMISTVEALSKYIITDFELTEIIGLAQLLNGMDTENDIYTAMEPTTSSLENGIWYEYLNTTEWQAMMKRVDAGLPPTTEDEVDYATGVVMASVGDTDGHSIMAQGDSSLGVVQVKNGAGIEGVATKAANRIAPLGYVVDATNAQSNDYTESVVVYADSKFASAAKEIAEALGIDEVYYDTEDLYFYDGDILVLVGKDLA